nr:hypothetical protein [Micromonospora sp. DSM 115978]
PYGAGPADTPGPESIRRLTGAVGPDWARQIALARRRIDARRALSIGLVHSVFPGLGFAARVQEFASQLAALPDEAVGLAETELDTSAGLQARADLGVRRPADPPPQPVDHLDPVRILQQRRHT